jgi:predicted nucleic acid-binding Zn ribbon protein
MIEKLDYITEVGIGLNDNCDADRIAFKRPPDNREIMIKINEIIEYINNITNAPKHKCNSCNSIKLKATGNCFTSNPPLYEYECEECGKKQSYTI